MTEATKITEDTKKKLYSYITRIETLDENITGLRSDIKDILLEADGNGFDKKAIKNILKMRKKSREEVIEEREITDLYYDIINEVSK